MEFISDSSDSTHLHKTQEEAKQDSISFILSPRKAQLSNSRRLCIKSISLSSFFQFEVLNWDFSEIDSSFNLTCEITDLHRCLSFIVWKPFSLKGSRVSYSKIGTLRYWLVFLASTWQIEVQEWIPVPR